VTDRSRPEIGPALAAAWRHTHAARAELRGWQDARLRRLVLHAYDAVPHFRRLFDRHRLHPRHIRGTVDLDLIPFTDKAQMQRQGPLGVLARGHDPAALHSVHGRGPSGEPFIVRRTWLEDKLHDLLRLRVFRAFGVRHRDRIVAVGDAGSFRTLGFQPRQQIAGLQDPAEIARRLREARPEVLVGMPCLLDRLSAPELADVTRAVRPRVVIVGGAAATPAMRLRIRETFGAPLYETYVSHECPVMAWECRHSGALHTCDGVIIEVLRDGRPAEPGERGDVVVTNLHAYAMPFLRYRIGDVATREGPCACGAPFSTIGEVRPAEPSGIPMNRTQPAAEPGRRMLGA
jgi:phenylacetate-CoA ligase